MFSYINNLLYIFFSTFLSFFLKIAVAVVLFWSQHYHVFDSISLNIQQLFRLCEKETSLLWHICLPFWVTTLRPLPWPSAWGSSTDYPQECYHYYHQIFHCTDRMMSIHILKHYIHITLIYIEISEMVGFIHFKRHLANTVYSTYITKKKSINHAIWITNTCTLPYGKLTALEVPINICILSVTW